MSFKISSIAALGAAILACTATALASPPTATIAKTCGVGSGTGYGYTYLTTLTVKGTSCGTGKKVVRHKGNVSGWHCKKTTLASSPVQIQARMKCSNGSKRVTYTYSQNR